MMNLSKFELQGGSEGEEGDKPCFSLMKMFKKPVTHVIHHQPSIKQEHPYIEMFKRLEEKKRKEMEERMEEGKVVGDEERRLREGLARDKKLFVRVEKGRETPYEAGGKGFAQVVEVSWGPGKDMEKKGKKEKESQQSKQRGEGRGRSNLTKKSLDHKRNHDRKPSKDLLQHKRLPPPRPLQRPPPSKRSKREPIQEEIFDNFLDSDSSEGIRGLQAAREMYGKYYNQQYIKRDQEVIKESTFDEMAREEKVSKAYARRDQIEEMRNQMKRRQEKKRKVKQESKEPA